MSLIRSMRGGKDYDAEWGKRMKGSGPYAWQIGRRFEIAAKRIGLNLERTKLRTDLFKRPAPARSNSSSSDPSHLFRPDRSPPLWRSRRRLPASAPTAGRPCGESGRVRASPHHVSSRFRFSVLLPGCRVAAGRRRAEVSGLRHRGPRDPGGRRACRRHRRGRPRSARRTGCRRRRHSRSGAHSRRPGRFQAPEARRPRAGLRRDNGDRAIGVGRLRLRVRHRCERHPQGQPRSDATRRAWPVHITPALPGRWTRRAASLGCESVALIRATSGPSRSPPPRSSRRSPAIA